MQGTALRLAFLAILVTTLSIFGADASTIEYIIYPIKDIDVDQIAAVETLIRGFAGKDTVYASKRLGRPALDFWVAPLDEEAYEKLRQHPWIKEIFPDEPLVEEFTEGKWGVQESAPEELRVISMPKNTDKSVAYYPNYVYPLPSREEMFIYHAELGINVQHLEFRGRRIEWVYTPRAIYKGHAIESESPLGKKPGHSTCTASKATGNTLGANKNATLVVVKMPDLRPSSVAEIFATISDHIKAKGRRYRSFVTVSWGSKKNYTGDLTRNLHWGRLAKDIAELSAMTPVVCAAGNAAELKNSVGQPRDLVDTFPALPAGFSKRGLVGSNCDNNGRRHSTSQKPRKGMEGLFAPGVNVQCARHDSEWKTWRKTGTSFSAPLMAGVFASTNGLGRTMPVSWTRSGGDNVIWDWAGDAQNPPVDPLASGLLLNSLSNYTDLMF